MGLEFVEIYMEVEDKFDILFETNEFQNVVTVGDFYKLIISKVDFQDVGYCIKLRVFNRFRKFCIEELGQARRDISPNKSLNIIFENPMTK
jgi:hypothetical protein